MLSVAILARFIGEPDWARWHRILIIFAANGAFTLALFKHESSHQQLILKCLGWTNHACAGGGGESVAKGLASLVDVIVCDALSFISTDGPRCFLRHLKDDSDQRMAMSGNIYLAWSWAIERKRTAHGRIPTLRVVADACKALKI